MGPSRRRSSRRRAARWSTRCTATQVERDCRSGRAGAARSASDRHRRGARVRECRAVCAVGSTIDVHATDHGRRFGDSGSGPRSRHRAGRSAAPLRTVLPRRRGEDARVGHRHGALDRAGIAGGGTGPGLGGELSGRRRAVHHRGSCSSEGRNPRPRRAHDATSLASCSSTMKSPSSAPWDRSCAHVATTSTLPAPARTRSRCVAEQPPDLIVLDLGLPDLEGTEVCRRVRG